MPVRSAHPMRARQMACNANPHRRSQALSQSMAAPIALFALACTASGQSVDPADRLSVMSYWHRTHLPAVANSNHGFTGSVATCDPGGLDPRFVIDTLTVVNGFRVMAGMPPVTFGDGRAFLSRFGTVVDCQQGALMMQAANMLSHTLPASGPCGSAAGAAALQFGLLSTGQGSNGIGPLGVALLMDGASSTSLGTRRLLLHEPQQQFAIGSTDRYFVLYPHGPSSNAPRTRPTAWPPAGFVPFPWVYQTWSFAVPGGTFGNATVTVTRDGMPLGLSAAPLQSGFGDNAVGWTFQPPLLLGGGMADTTFHVTIANVGNAPQSTYSYTVTVIDPNRGQGTLQVQPHSCGTLSLSATGTAGIGSTTTFSLANATGLPLLFLGFRPANNSAFCPPCTFGPDPESVTVGTSHSLAVPLRPAFLGAQLGVQGADFLGGGGCMAPMFSLSDTIVVTIG